jgi:hypothetical protein
MRWAVALLGVLVGGCALTTPAPGGPMRSGVYSQLQPTWAIAYGPASATVDGVPVSGAAQTRHFGGGGLDPLPNPVPLTLGVRQAWGAHVEGSVDVGWVNSGVGLRLALPRIGDAEPLVISAGARSGLFSVDPDDSYEGRLSLEAYPVLSGSGTHSLRLLLSAGVTTGAFVHELLLPASYGSRSDAPSGSPVARVLRPELRLQTSVGVFLMRERFGLAVSLSPWILLRAEEPTSATCEGCDAPHVVANFAQTWGVSLSIAPSFGSDLRH